MAQRNLAQPDLAQPDLAPWRDRPDRAAVVTDFDGTLAPIVADPATSAAVPGAVDVLGRLVDRLGLVAAVSGRPASFLAERLPVPGLVLAGLYGLERQVDGRIVSPDEALAWRPALAALVDAAQREAPAGVGIEDKGLAVTLHARAAPKELAWIEAFVDRRARSEGLSAHPGKLSFEVRPPVPVDKGTVLTDLSGGLEAVCFCGDDLGDLPAFAALAALRRTGVATVGVAAAGPETPEEVLAAADVVVDGPSGVVRFLRSLAGTTQTA